MIKPTATKVRLPTKVMQGDGECWWWDNYQDSWALGSPLLMDFTREEAFEKYTHWLPKEAIMLP